MNVFYKPKKSTAPCSGGSTDSSITTVPKKNLFFSMFKRLLPLMILFIWTESSAQFSFYPSWWVHSHYVLEWDPYVGCSQPSTRFDEIIPDRCMRACKGSTVEYFVKDYIINMAWGDPEEFTIDWTVTGGTVMDVYDETDPQYGIKIKWSDTAHTGSIKIEVYTDSYYRLYWLCVRLINNPIADFEIIGEGEFCKNSPIFFNNLSVANGYGGIKSTLWDFGDGNYSSQYHPQHSYEQPGSYVVTLTVTNWCNCESIYKMTLTVVEKPAPIISCPGVVVEKETVTYTTEDPCGGKWIAEGGTIIDGGSGDYATIVWDGIDPAEGFGYIHYFSECTCPTTVKVPVVTKRALIKGDPFICEGDQNKFTLPQWPTTEFNWYIVYGDGSSTVITTEQPNEVFVEGVQAGTHTLVCEYYNTLWGYSGTAELTITVGKKAEITGDYTEFCAGSGTYTYTNVGGDPVTWKLMRDGNVITGIPSYGNTFSYHFPVGGTYMLTATTDEGCVSEPFVIDVTQIPALTGEIQGQGFVCEDITYQYTYENDEPGTVLIWEASGGAVLQGNNTGNTVSVKFTGSGPYTLKVKRRSQDDPICWSPNELTKSIYKVNLIPTITNDTNPLNEFCPSSTTVFTANFAPGFIPDHIQWTLESDGSTPNSNFGNIVLGGNGNEVTINWNEISSGVNTGVLTLNVTHCGQTEIIPTNVALHTMPVLTLSLPTFICPGDGTIDVTVNAPGVTTGQLLFSFTNGYTESKSIHSSGNYTITNGFTNATATNITQSLTVTLLNPNGCHYSPSDTKTAEIYPETKITITPGYNVAICLEETPSYSHTLTSNLSTGPTSSAEFRWYKDNTPITGWIIGTPGASYVINNANQGATPQGTYYVAVKDGNNCIVYSNEINVVLYCPEEVDCDITPVPVIAISGEWNCNQIKVTLDYNHEPDSIQWTIGQGVSFTGQNIGVTTAEGYFNSIEPGAHLIFAKLYYGDCFIVRMVEVKKHYQPILSLGASCNTSGTYNVTLNNNSLVFDIDTDDITFEYYDQTNTLLGTTTGDSISLTGVAPGTYTYRLELSVPSDPTKPVCSVERTITLYPLTPPVFTLDEEFCAEDTIELIIPNYNENLTYKWWFDDTSIFALGATTEVNIANVGPNKEITLRAHLPFGCTTEYTITDIEIKTAAGLEGSFSPPSITGCEGETFPAIEFEPANPSGPIPSGYIWMQGNEPVPGETGITFTPTQSGQYWAVLIDENGCKNYDMAVHPVDVNIRLRPFVSVSGTNSLCYGDSTTIKGAVTDDSLKRQWFLNGSPMSGSYGVLSDTTPLEFEITNLLPGLTAGTYEYELYVEPVDDATCGNSFTFELVAHEELVTPLLDYDVIMCSPYTVHIGVTNVQPGGSYYWSNGTTGSYTQVMAGGVYQVTYVAPTGCEITAEIIIPEDPEKSMWIFPTGCFDVCIWDTDPQPYIIGPQGIYDTHRWFVNDVSVQGGSGVIDPLDLRWAGAYQLIIWDQGCTYETDFAYITPDIEECAIEPCPLDYAIEGIDVGEDVYYVYGAVYSGYGAPITVTFTSLNGYGTYSPANVTIPASGSYSLSPLIFTPNPGFNGGDDYLVISVMGDSCVTLVPIDFEPFFAFKTMPQGTELLDNSMATLKVTPNPSEVLAAVSYNLGTEYQKAESIKIYAIDGRLVAEIAVEEHFGTLALDISHFPAGTYIITLQADGNTVLYQKLIKK